MKRNTDIKRIEVQGFEVAYSTFGEGKKIAVVAQGWGTSFEMYQTIANAISDNYKVILFDFPGFGRTEEPEYPWSVSEYATFFTDFLNALNIEKATLIGHSFGGRVIIEIASNDTYKKYGDNIVLIDSAGVMPTRSSYSRFKTKIFKTWKKFITSKVIYPLFPDIIDYWISKQGSEDYRNASETMKGVLVKAVNYDQQHLMDKIDAQTLLIWGDQDDATPVSDGKIMEEKFRQASLVVMEGCGHFSYAEDPKKFTSILRAFLC